ncbi:hypothetical protein L9F63_005830, partial [Diploptera punctata]
PVNLELGKLVSFTFIFTKLTNHIYHGLSLDLAGITREMISIVRRNYRVIKNWTGLAHTLGLSHRVHGIRSKVNIYCEEADICIFYLLEDWIGQSSKEATLGRLLYALREEQHNDCADELEEKFA